MLTGLFACADIEMEDAAADGGAAGPSRPSGQAVAQAGPLSTGQREAVLMQMNQILTRQVSLTVDELMAALAAKGLRYGRQAVKQASVSACMAGRCSLNACMRQADQGIWPPVLNKASTELWAPRQPREQVLAMGVHADGPRPLSHASCLSLRRQPRTSAAAVRASGTWNSCFWHGWCE